MFNQGMASVSECIVYGSNIPSLIAMLGKQNEVVIQVL